MSGLAVSRTRRGRFNISKQELDETLRARIECFIGCCRVQIFVGSSCTKYT